MKRNVSALGSALAALLLSASGAPCLGTPLAELTIAELRFDDSQPARVWVALANRGERDASTFVVRLTAPDEPNRRAVDTPVDLLAAREQIWIVIEDPAGRALNLMRFRILVDADDDVPEGDERDNLREYAPADLEIGRPASIDGHPPSLRVPVINSGSWDSPRCVLRVTVRKISGARVDAYEDHQVRPIAAGERLDLPIDVGDLVGDSPLDEAEFTFRVDALNQVVESNENNNELQWP